MKFETIAREYATLWDNMEITRDAKVMASTVDKIMKCRAAYEAVEQATGVPWYIIGIMDMREGGGGARTHLHNGDSLSRPTVQIPPNRPPGSGPFTFFQSAVDCVVAVKKWDRVTDWTVERMAYVFETMNGFGYRYGPVSRVGRRRVRHPPMLSPYLWGGTNHQQPGKYVKDRVFSPSVVDTQHGCMPLLKLIAGRAGLEIPSMFGATPDATEPSPASNAKAEEPLPAVSPGAAAVGGTGLIGGGALLADPAGVTSTAVAVKANAGQLLSGVDLALWGVPLVILLGVLAYLWWSRKP